MAIVPGLNVIKPNTGSGPTAGLGRGQQGLGHGPLIVHQVGRVAWDSHAPAVEPAPLAQGLNHPRRVVVNRNIPGRPMLMGGLALR